MTATDTDIAVGQNFVAAFAEGDLDRLMALLHPDIETTLAPGLPYGGTYHGTDGFLKFAGALAALVEIRDVSATVRDTGDKLVTHIEFTFVTRATGRALRTSAVELYTVTNGRIRKIEPFYYDTAAVADLCTEEQK